ncbi:uncharacterized protein KD926_008024 [Aspergillus affinis]|uniref:uncharacterized protein n=1 Tax=Aspergillus affinis TaxID=1070780 RepID=UPI0022FE75D7|nr:uncharacterized protein KD926_008024 [Aspergillus affinis]KAI9045608.1 hypothetical protein KD926_008024 [Aspergillus affinis]
MEPSHPPNPNPSSLLWAHQIRREHIHLVHQIDTLKADLAVATDTMNDLRHDLEALTSQVEDTKQCNAQVEGTLLRLEDRLNEQLHTILERMNGLETENGLLKTRVEVLEAERQHAGEHRERESSGIVSQRQKTTTARQPTVLRIACENGVFKRARSRGSLDSDANTGQYTRFKDGFSLVSILAPDSMPANESSPLPLLRPQDFVRSLSETTLTSSYVSRDGGTHDNIVQARSANTNSNQGGTGRTDPLTKEKRSRLADFWTSISSVYMTRPYRFPENCYVRGFVRSIQDTDTRVLLEARCRDTGCCSWDGLKALVHEITGESEDDAAVGERAMQPGSDIQQATTGNGNPAKPTLKRKRYIAIVPPDQDEQLVIDAYGRGWPGVS